MAVKVVKTGQSIRVHLEFDWLGPAENARVDCILVLPGVSLAASSGAWARTASGGFAGAMGLSWTVPLASSFPAAHVQITSPDWRLGPNGECHGPLNLGCQVWLVGENHLAIEGRLDGVVSIVDAFNCVRLSPGGGGIGIF